MFSKAIAAKAAEIEAAMREEMEREQYGDGDTITWTGNTRQHEYTPWFEFRITGADWSGIQWLSGEVMHGMLVTKSPEDF